MYSRHQARECALQALYQCDVREDYSPALVDIYFEAFQTEDEQSELLEFSKKIIAGVTDHLQEIDRVLQEAAKNWKVSRMSRLDRNILRIAVYEIQYGTDIPLKVCINEAVELAKQYGGEESPQFVNGVLDKVGTMVASGSPKECPPIVE
ncbi:MAG: transcription antitermination factor NusB [Bdellovibrionales bacterium]|nr:transcription antitermination factor NusB [Bdellovibrionales bacterium]